MRKQGDETGSDKEKTEDGRRKVRYDTQVCNEYQHLQGISGSMILDLRNSLMVVATLNLDGFNSTTVRNILIKMFHR